MIKGVLFDFDGTIVDSEISRFESTNAVLQKYNIKISRKEWDEKYKRLPSVMIFNDVLQVNEVEADSEELYKQAHGLRKEIEKRDGVEVIRGFFEFWDFLKKKDIKIAICSGSTREHLEAVMDIVGIENIKSITREDYEKVKPAPDCYLKGLEELGLKPEETLVFDDSFTGGIAAQRAKCKFVAINSENEKGIETLNPVLRVRNYTEIDLDDILKL